MANEKISELPVAGTVTGADVVPILQGGANKKTLLSTILAYIQTIIGWATTGTTTLTGDTVIDTDGNTLEFTGDMLIEIIDDLNSKTAIIKNDDGLKIDGGSGVFLKWPLADGTAGQVMKTDGAGTLAFQYPLMALGNIPLTEYTFVGGIFEDLASGSTDLYTVPAGKKAVVLEAQGLYNNTAGSVSTYSQIKISGTYYRIGLAVSQGANSGGNVTFNNSICLNAGESYSINTASTGQSVFVSIVEFDDDVPIKRIGSVALGTGDNTVYTVPANKKAFLTSLSNPGNNCGGYLRAVNVSGGSVTLTPYSIESGQAKAAKYQNQAATAVGNNAQSLFAVSPQLNTGDFILINSTSASAGQIVFGTVIEI